jgi:hypothetical protein
VNLGEHYWENDLPVQLLIRALLGNKAGFGRVLFTDSREAALSFLKQ